ncbi:MAG: C10 family peptidase [Desulfosarcinaceae bacterium]|nr:C10 family peptidase [Desulfosarcinaceae bacterium]
MGLLHAALSTAAEVDLAVAQQVASAEIRRHIDLYGAWGAGDAAHIASGETVWREGVALAHSFGVWPSGHILVAADDRFSPVLLYSPDSAFIPERVDDPASIEAWILPEILRTLRRISSDPTTGLRSLGRPNPAAERILSAWSHYRTPQATVARTLNGGGDALARSNEDHSVGPMMDSRWGQGDHYNAQIPGIDGACQHALTGCVATAFAQVMRYWQWPYKGMGAHSYLWAGQTIGAEFDTPYDWDFMPDRLSGSSTPAQVEAVAHLISDVAVAVETDFGCSGSSSTRYGDEILDRFFRYKSQMMRHSRSRYSATGWFGLIQDELDADPPRPMLFSIFTSDWSGHEVVIDGYQTGPTDKVHINMGWSGAYNGYYDITHNFTAAYEWQADYQVLVTGIEPDNTAPWVDAGTDQVVVMGAVVTLPGSALDPDGFSLARVGWIQHQGPQVELSDPQAVQTTFTAPLVSSDTVLAFELQVTDQQGARSSDTLTITIYPPSEHPVAEAGNDQVVSAGSRVSLTGSAMASEGHEIQTYTWMPLTDSEQRAVQLTAENAQQTSFIAPDVLVDTDLAFTFQVTDTSGQMAEDVCVVTVRAAVAPPPEADANVEPVVTSPADNVNAGRSSSGGGPCFISSITF